MDVWTADTDCSLVALGKTNKPVGRAGNHCRLFKEHVHMHVLRLQVFRARKRLSCFLTALTQLCFNCHMNTHGAA